MLFQQLNLYHYTFDMWFVVLIEMDRDASRAVTRVVGHSYLGMSIIDDDRGVLFKGAV